MELKEKLAYLRKEKGLTQLELAEAMLVSRQAVSKWETGRTMPSAENLKLLSELYEVSIDDLLNNQEEKPAKEAMVLIKEVVPAEIVPVPEKRTGKHKNHPTKNAAKS